MNKHERYTVLVWRGNSDPIYYGPITDDEDRDAAYLQVFTDLDGWGVYYDLVPDADRPDHMTLEKWQHARRLYGLAVNGHAGAAREIVSSRTDNEYEGVHEYPLHCVEGKRP